MDKIRRSLAFISVEITVPGVSPGRQATLSFLGRSLFFGGRGGDLKQIGLRLQPGCEGRCRKMTETAVWGFPPPGHVISVTPAGLRSPRFQLNQGRKSSTFIWASLPWQLGPLPPPRSYFHRLHRHYAATLMSTLAATECSPIDLSTSKVRYNLDPFRPFSIIIFFWLAALGFLTMGTRRGRIVSLVTSLVANGP